MKKQALCKYTRLLLVTPYTRCNHFDICYLPNVPHTAAPGSMPLQLQQFWTQARTRQQKEASQTLHSFIQKCFSGFNRASSALCDLMLHPLSQSLHLIFHLPCISISISAPTEPLAVSSTSVNSTAPKKGFSVDIGSFLFLLPLDGRSKRTITCSIRFLLNSKMDT